MEMTNLTIAVPREVLDRLRVLAAKKKKSVSRFVNEELVRITNSADENWVAEHKALLEEIGPRKREGVWNREEIYAERLK